MSWDKIKLSDIPAPTDAEMAELATLVDEFEENHQEALEHEAEVSAISPAVFACDLFKRPKNPVTAVLPDFFYSGAITGIFAAPKVGKSLLLCHLLESRLLHTKSPTKCYGFLVKQLFMPTKGAFNTLSRLRNLGRPCSHCNQPITALAQHLDSIGRHICPFMPVAGRTRLANEAMYRDKE